MGYPVQKGKEVNVMKFTKRLGMILLCLWLIMTGLIVVLNLSFSELPLVMGILAIAAGVLLLFDR